MNEIPDAADIILTVRDFLARIGPLLAKGAKFEAQVATYLLDIVHRELPAPVQGSDELELCRKIRAGACDSEWNALLRSQLAEAVARVRIVRPGYLGNEISRP